MWDILAFRLALELNRARAVLFLLLVALGDFGGTCGRVLRVDVEKALLEFYLIARRHGGRENDEGEGGDGGKAHFDVGLDFW